MTLFQNDIARHLDVSAMTVSRAVKSLGRSGEQLTEDAALLLLTAGELTALGLAWAVALDLVSKFSDTVAFLAVDPSVRQGWILFVEKGETRFQVAAVSRNHLAAILEAHPLSLVLALHRPVEDAAEHLRALLKRKVAA